MQNWAIAVAALVALAISACTSSTSTPEAVSGPTIDDACTQLAKARCTRLDECSKDALIPKNWTDAANCQARQKLSCVQGQRAANTGTTPQRAIDCAMALTAATCTEILATVPPTACQAAVGTEANGSACAFAGQCQSSYCAIPTRSNCGTCAPAPKVGASCDVFANCGPALKCDATTMQCATPVALGGDCDAGRTCDSEMSCVGADATKSLAGKCQTSGAVVAAACEGAKLTLPACDSSLGLVCEQKACVAWTLVGDGEPCGTTATGVYSQCKSGGVCIKAVSTDKTGLCKVAVADGAACDSDPTKGPPCLSPARCVAASATTTAGICTVPDAAVCK